MILPRNYLLSILILTSKTSISQAEFLEDLSVIKKLHGLVWRISGAKEDSLLVEKVRRRYRSGDPVPEMALVIPGSKGCRKDVFRHPIGLTEGNKIAFCVRLKKCKGGFRTRWVINDKTTRTILSYYEKAQRPLIKDSEGIGIPEDLMLTEDECERINRIIISYPSLSGRDEFFGRKKFFK